MCSGTEIIHELNTDPDQEVVVYNQATGEVFDVVGSGYAPGAHVKAIVVDVPPPPPDLPEGEVQVDVAAGVKEWWEDQQPKESDGS
jgi:hypothetical protein